MFPAFCDRAPRCDCITPGQFCGNKVEIEMGDKGEGFLSNNPPAVDQEEFDRISKLSLKELLEEARMGAVRTLLLKVMNHEASAAELAVLRNLLRDNGLILGLDGDMEEATGEGPAAIGFHLPDLEPEENE